MATQKKKKERAASLATHDIDLTPRGATEIDLFGKESEIGFLEWGTTHRRSLKDWTPEKGAIAKTESDAIDQLLKRSTKAQMIAWLTDIGASFWPHRQTKASLATTIHIVVNDRRYPRVFVNAAPNYYTCSCGHVGPAIKKNGAVSCGAPFCNRPRYALQLTRPPY